MDTQTRNNIIGDYSREHLSPTTRQRGKISARYQELCSFLTGPCFMTGSYARFTAVRPPKDLDVIWVSYDARLQQEPRYILEGIAARLYQKYQEDSCERIELKVQDHSIAVIFLDDPDGFSMDVVPAAELGKANEFGDPFYCVPEIQKMSHIQRKAFTGIPSWIPSDPKGYITVAQKLEQLTEGHFRKTAKIVKAWRQKHKIALGDDFKLKSFHAEQLVSRHLLQAPASTVLDSLHTVFSELGQAIERPQIPDRADPKVFIDQYVTDLSWAEKAKILTLQGEAFDIINLLQAAESEQEINRLMDQLTQPAKKTTIPAYVAPAVIISNPPKPYGGSW